MDYPRHTPAKALTGLRGTDTPHQMLAYPKLSVRFIQVRNPCPISVVSPSAGNDVMHEQAIPGVSVQAPTPTGCCPIGAPPPIGLIPVRLSYPVAVFSTPIPNPYALDVLTGGCVARSPVQAARVVQRERRCQGYAADRLPVRCALVVTACHEWHKCHRSREYKGQGAYEFDLPKSESLTGHYVPALGFPQRPRKRSSASPPPRSRDLTRQQRQQTSVWLRKNP